MSVKWEEAEILDGAILDINKYYVAGYQHLIGDPKLCECGKEHSYVKLSAQYTCKKEDAQ